MVYLPKWRMRFPPNPPILRITKLRVVMDLSAKYINVSLFLYFLSFWQVDAKYRAVCAMRVDSKRHHKCYTLVKLL